MLDMLAVWEVVSDLSCRRVRCCNVSNSGYRWIRLDGRIYISAAFSRFRHLVLPGQMGQRDSTEIVRCSMADPVFQFSRSRGDGIGERGGGGIESKRKHVVVPTSKVPGPIGSHMA